MLSRRSVLMTGAASAAVAALARPGFAADSPSVALNALFDGFVNENLDLSPTFATGLGVDTGARKHQKSELDEASLAAIVKGQTQLASQLARLSTFDRN